MALRCLLFSSDEGTAESVCQVLAGLGVEGEYCADAVAAVEKVTNQPFQLVIIDWDKQPEAGFLLTTARERKASERALTLAIVSDDASVPKALQAGANSILRKPMMVNQVRDTLTTARDLLRAKFESANAAAQAAAAGASGSAGLPASGSGSDTTLRAGEFLSTAGAAPATQIDTVSEMQKDLENSAGAHVDPLKELEPMAAAVSQEKSAPPPPRQTDEPRGLQWYLNSRAGGQAAAPAPAHAFPPSPPVPDKTELLGFDQTPAQPAESHEHSDPGPAPRRDEHEEKAEAKLFAYIEGEKDPAESEKKSRPSFRLAKGPVIGALALAACAVVAAPQAPWHPSLRGFWGRGRQAVHGWLNPQLVTPTQAPVTHENFGRPGDEYKLPVAENIPDATTDPSQIRVVPIVDPTIKKPNNAGANVDPAAVQPSTDGTAPNPTDGTQPGVQVQETQPGTDSTQPAGGTAPGVTAQPIGSTTAVSSAASSATGNVATTSSVTVDQPHPDQSASATLLEPASAPPLVSRNPQPHPITTPTSVPSSLKSQMASMTPAAGGNKLPEAALPSIEPVSVDEAAERALLTDQPTIAYPANAKGQQGTVMLEVLIGRDGTVQDAKFLSGSLAFARAAIDGVKQWKFKPYMMNGRPVSVQTSFTMTFKPTA